MLLWTTEPKDDTCTREEIMPKSSKAVRLAKNNTRKEVRKFPRDVYSCSRLDLPDAKPKCYAGLGPRVWGLGKLMLHVSNFQKHSPEGFKDPGAANPMDPPSTFGTLIVPPPVDGIWGMWGSFDNIPTTIFHLNLLRGLI